MVHWSDFTAPKSSTVPGGAGHDRNEMTIINTLKGSANPITPKLEVGLYKVLSVRGAVNQFCQIIGIKRPFYKPSLPLQ